MTAATLFASFRLLLTTRFLAIYLLSQAETGLSALALKRRIGVSYRNAWLIHHKFMMMKTSPCAASDSRERSINSPSWLTGRHGGQSAQ